MYIFVSVQYLKKTHALILCSRIAVQPEFVLIYIWSLILFPLYLEIAAASFHNPVSHHRQFVFDGNVISVPCSFISTVGSLYKMLFLNPRLCRGIIDEMISHLILHFPMKF